MSNFKSLIPLSSIILLLTFIDISNSQHIECQNRLSGGEVVNKNFKEVLTFTYNKQGHICIDAKINESEVAHTFLLDSYSSCFFSKKLTENLKLNVLDMTKVYGKTNDNCLISKYPKCEKIKIGSIVFKDIGGSMISSEKKCDITNINENGIIGSNLLKNCIWQFNFQDTTITISDQLKNLSYIQNATRIPFKPESTAKHPNIQVIVNEKDTLSVQFDLAAPGRVINLNALSLQKSQESLRQNTAKSPFVKLKSLKVGSKEFYNIPAKLIRIEDKRIKTNGNIGLGFLEHFIVTIDWLNNYIYLDQFEDIN